MSMKGYSTFPKGPVTRASPSDCLMSYPKHSGGVGCGLNPQQRCSQCILLITSNFNFQSLKKEHYPHLIKYYKIGL